METAINLRWHAFAQNLGSSSSSLRHQNHFTDVTLAAEDQQVEAHKFILSTCSPFFNNILLKNSHPHPLIYLKGVRFCDLTSLLDFMYCGEVNIQQKDLDYLLSAAEDLQVQGLTENGSEGDQSKEGMEEGDSSKSAATLSITDLTVKQKSNTSFQTKQKKESKDKSVEITPMVSAENSLNSSADTSIEVVNTLAKKRKLDSFAEPASPAPNGGRKRSRADFSVERPSTRRSLTTQETNEKGNLQEKAKQSKLPEKQVSESKENDPSDQTIAGIEELLKLSHRVLAESDENSPQDSSQQQEENPRRGYKAKEPIPKSPPANPAPPAPSPVSYKNANFKSSTPAKSPQDKTKAMIDLMLVKKNGQWRCSICNKTWPLNVKKEAESHIGTVHMVNGTLTK